MPPDELRIMLICHIFVLKDYFSLKFSCDLSKVHLCTFGNKIRVPQSFGVWLSVILVIVNR